MLSNYQLLKTILSTNKSEEKYPLFKSTSFSSPILLPSLPPPPLPPSSVSLPHLLLSVPGSLSHTLGEWRSRAEQALIYGLTVQSCPEYLQTSSLSPARSKFSLKAHKSIPSHSLCGLRVNECVMTHGKGTHSPRGAQYYCCNTLARGSHPQRTRKTGFQDSPGDALWGLKSPHF